MFVEDNNREQLKNMIKNTQQPSYYGKQLDNLSIPGRPRACSESSSHKRSQSVGGNIKKTNSAKQNHNNNVNCKKLTPLTPSSLLCYTIVNRDEFLLLKLLTIYPNEVNKLSDEGFSPLHLAAMDGNIEIMNILLEHGAVVNCYDHKSRTALEYAVLSGQFDAAQFLIENGCDSTLIRDGYSGGF